MIITEVTYARGATINTGNYSSVRFDISATARIDVDDHEDANKVFREIKEWVDVRLAAEVGRVT